MQALSPPELAAWLADEQRKQPVLLDVREPWEFNICKLPGSELVSMQAVPAKVHDLDPKRDVVCICHHGGRSMHVGMFLTRQGFDRVYNLTGGLDAWARQVDPAMPTY